MEKLRRLRTERGLSQARLAARAELDPSTVNQIERGAREASPATLRKLAEALDVSLPELLEEVSPKVGRRSSPEPTFNDVLRDERHLRYLRAWRALAGDLWLQWSEQPPTTSAEIAPLITAMKALVKQGVFDTSDVADPAELDDISVLMHMLQKLNDMADAVEQDETAEQRRETFALIQGNVSA
jgi:transcriptional regulator with XRE-family HTH domain